MTRWLAIAYLLVLHLTVAVLVTRTNFIPLAYKTLGYWVAVEEYADISVRTLLDQANQAARIGPGSIMLLGDSIMAGVDAGSVGPGAANFGLGGDTTHLLRRRLATLPPIASSRAAVVLVGVNDLKFRSLDEIAANYAELLAALPEAARVVAVSVLPLDETTAVVSRRGDLRNAKVTALNAAIQAVCAARANCRYLDAWPAFYDTQTRRLRADYHRGDGWHLNDAGGRLLGGLIRIALAVR